MTAVRSLEEEEVRQNAGRTAVMSVRKRLGGRRSAAGPGMFVALALVVLIAGVAVIPIVILLVMSLYSASFLTQPGHFTLDNYTSIFSDPLTWQYLWNTILFMSGGAMIAVTLGTLMAFGVTSINVPWRPFLRILPLGGMLIPALIKDPSWLMLFSPETGLVNVWFRSTFGTQGAIFDVLTMHGLIIAAGVFTAPIAYVVMLAPLESMDRSYIEASRIAGARIGTTVRRIVVPMVRPAVLSGGILAMLTVASSFETPVIIGIPAGVNTYMTLVYQSVESPSLGFNIAAAQSAIYLAITVSVMFFYFWATRNERRFVTVSGKGNVQSLLRLPVLRWVFAGIVMVHALFGFIGPLLITFAASFLPFFTATTGNPFENLTLANYEAVFADERVRDAMASSALLSTATVVGALIAGGVLSFVALKSKFRFRRVAEFVGVGPQAMPATVYSVGLLLTVLSVPGLAAVAYGSIWIMWVAQVIVFLPLVTRLLSSALIQIQDELLDASTLSGAGLWRSVRSIVLPLLRPALLYSAAMVFLQSYRELGAVVLLTAQNAELVPMVIFRYLVGGGFTTVAALNMLTLIVPLLFLVVVFTSSRSRRRQPTLSPTQGAF